MNLEPKTLDQIVGVIVASTTLTWDEVMAKVRDVQQELHGFVTADGAASLLAYRMNIFKDEVRDLGKIGDGVSPSGQEIESRSTLHPDSYSTVFPDSRSTEPEEKIVKDLGGIGMGVSDIYPPSLLNVQTVNGMDLWDKPQKISGCEVREFIREGQTTRKIVLKLEGLPEGFALNATNAKTLAKVWSNDYTTWSGKQLKLVRVRVLFKGQQMDSIGVVAM